MNERKLRAGDRVRATELQRKLMPEGVTKDDVGTVIGFDPDLPMEMDVVVDFGRDIGGRKLTINGKTTGEGAGWICFEDYLEVVGKSSPDSEEVVGKSGSEQDEDDLSLDDALQITAYLLHKLGELAGGGEKSKQSSGKKLILVNDDDGENLGTVGEPTDPVDDAGRKLYVGDVVSIRSTIDNPLAKLLPPLPAAVCKENGEAFFMGMRNSSREHKDSEVLFRQSWKELHAGDDAGLFVSVKEAEE